MGKLKDSGENKVPNYRRISILQFFKLFLLVSVIYTSCVGGGDAFEKRYWSDPNYYIADDEMDNCKTLYKKIHSESAIGRISCITKFGFNELYIIAESHHPQNDTIDQYWILNKSTDDQFKNADQVVKGPFSLIDFNNEKLILGLHDLNFHKNWE